MILNGFCLITKRILRTAVLRHAVLLRPMVFFRYAAIFLVLIITFIVFFERTNKAEKQNYSPQRNTEKCQNISDSVIISNTPEYNIEMIPLPTPTNLRQVYNNPYGLKLRSFKFKESFSKVCSESVSSKKLNITILPGGIWNPSNCKSKRRTAILVPYRNRTKNLKTFLLKIHNLMQYHYISYGIYVIEQNDNLPFNRGKLLNIGYLLSMHMFTYNCLIIHDVDKIPNSRSIQYDCNKTPLLLMKMIRHQKLKKWKNAQPYLRYFGGVVAITPSEYKLINGMVNHYWGWGGEDDDFYNRLEMCKLKPSKTKKNNYYVILDHPKNNNYSYRYYPSVVMTSSQMKLSGLSNLKFKLISISYKNEYTLIKVVL